MEQFTVLRSNVKLLGEILGETIARAHGPGLLAKVEQIRHLSKAAVADDNANLEALSETLSSLDAHELVPVARAFSHFLNLANTAEQLQTISHYDQSDLTDLGQLFEQLAPEPRLATAVEALDIELVLTAHPTEVTRRSIIQKQVRISQTLEQLNTARRAGDSTASSLAQLRQLVAEIWHTPEIRDQRPSPIDEARWGFAVIENALWQAVPAFLRELDQAQQAQLGRPLPIAARPVHFAFWMGGDRDGNPNVTAEVTREVLLLARWKAADLYLTDIRALGNELSMTDCNAALRERVAGAREPYRALLRQLETRLEQTLVALDGALHGEPLDDEACIALIEELLEPLQLCYDSLQQLGIGVVAEGAVLDLLRKVHCFGVHLMRLDIRQESQRHTDVLCELCHYLDLGDYAAWSESSRQNFLLRELASRRPLLPRNWRPSPAVQEVLDSCAVAAAQAPGALGAYVISMARQASDVLAVKLLLRECGCHWNIPVAPLFETLEDLDHAGDIVEQLLASPQYRELCGGQQMVMIGYSDSAKDAGFMAAAWAQYRAQERLIAVCQEHGVELTLFHGRGGTIGRGGAPARAALLSQPPGSLQGGLRVTEQGETIRLKLGLPRVAAHTLKLYTGAILEANLHSPPRPDANWRATMDALSALSAGEYRRIVRDTHEFIDYFRQATPVDELGELPLGSRPVRRKRSAGIEGLRAIPWQFAWMQNRLLLPTWLGAGLALREQIGSGDQTGLETMCRDWPFFSSRIGMLEMVYAKSDSALAALYDKRLVNPALRPLGQQLRDMLANDIAAVLSLTNDDTLMEDAPWSKRTVALRNIYTTPLHLLQTELLARHRAGDSELVRQALMISIAGIAAGMRNTG